MLDYLWCDIELKEFTILKVKAYYTLNLYFWKTLHLKFWIIREPNDRMMTVYEGIWPYLMMWQDRTKNINHIVTLQFINGNIAYTKPFLIVVQLKFPWVIILLQKFYNLLKKMNNTFLITSMIGIKNYNSFFYWKVLYTQEIENTTTQKTMEMMVNLWKMVRDPLLMLVRIMIIINKNFKKYLIKSIPWYVILTYYITLAQ